MQGIDTVIIAGSFMLVFLGTLAFIDFRTQPEAARRAGMQMVKVGTAATMLAVVVAALVGKICLAFN